MVRYIAPYLTNECGRDARVTSFVRVPYIKWRTWPALLNFLFEESTLGLLSYSPHIPLQIFREVIFPRASR